MSSEKPGSFASSLSALLLSFVLCTFLPTIFMFQIRDTMTPTIYGYMMFASVLGCVSFLGALMTLAELNGEELKIETIKKGVE